VQVRRLQDRAPGPVVGDGDLDTVIVHIQVNFDAARTGVDRVSDEFVESQDVADGLMSRDIVDT
jgi:hypothetical protein